MRARYVAAYQQFFIELFGRPQAGVLNLDIAVGIVVIPHCQPHQVDHVPRKILNSHRFSHIQHEHIAAAGHRTGLNHELCRLGNRHEIANDLAMRHGHRTAGTDLLAKQGNNRTGRLQDIAEPDHGETDRRVLVLHGL